MNNPDWDPQQAAREIIGPHEKPYHDSPEEWCTACRCLMDGVADRIAAALASCHCTMPETPCPEASDTDGG